MKHKTWAYFTHKYNDQCNHYYFAFLCFCLQYIYWYDSFYYLIKFCCCSSRLVLHYGFGMIFLCFVVFSSLSRTKYFVCLIGTMHAKECMLPFKIILRHLSLILKIVWRHGHLAKFNIIKNKKTRCPGLPIRHGGKIYRHVYHKQI